MAQVMQPGSRHVPAVSRAFARQHCLGGGSIADTYGTAEPVAVPAKSTESARQNAGA